MHDIIRTLGSLHAGAKVLPQSSPGTWFPPCATRRPLNEPSAFRLKTHFDLMRYFPGETTVRGTSLSTFRSLGLSISRSAAAVHSAASGEARASWMVLGTSGWDVPTARAYSVKRAVHIGDVGKLPLRGKRV